MTVSDDLLPFDDILLKPSEFRFVDDDDADDDNGEEEAVVILLETLPFDGNCLRFGVKRFI